MDLTAITNVDHRGVATGGRPVDPRGSGEPEATLDAKARRRLRRLVDPSKRKRTAMACDACKRRKQKCNGLHPCNKCEAKGCECVYAPQDGRFYYARATPKGERQGSSGSQQSDSSMVKTSHSPESTYGGHQGSAHSMGTQVSPNNTNQPAVQQVVQHAQSVQVNHGHATVPNQGSSSQTNGNNNTNTNNNNNKRGYDWRQDGASSRHHQFQQSAIREQRASDGSVRAGSDAGSVSGSITGSTGSMSGAAMSPRSPPSQPPALPGILMNESGRLPPPTPTLPPPQALGTAYGRPSSRQHLSHGMPLAPPRQAPPNPGSTFAQPVGSPHRSSSSGRPALDGGSQHPGMHLPSMAMGPGHGRSSTAGSHSGHDSSSDITNVPGSTISRGSQSDFPIETVGDGTGTRLLSSVRGKLNYIGESCTLSLLEQARHLFRLTQGESSFTEDPERFHFVDGPELTPALSAVQLPARETADRLFAYYVENVHTMWYVFDLDAIRADINDAYLNPLAVKRPQLCLLHLMFAIGAIFYCDDHPNAGFTPQMFFESGLGILLHDVVGDGDMWVVQGYLLSSLYFELVSKRNSSWVHLGVAIRYAQSLGLGRKWVDRRFDKRTERHRHRLWRTLFILDRLRSAMLGRALAIDNADMVEYLRSEDDNPDPEWLPTVRLCELCKILGDVMLNVYRSPNIYSSRAQALVDNLKQWAAEFQRLVVDSGTQFSSKGAKANILLINLVYLHSLILLTRPFFFYSVSRERANLKQTDGFEPEAMEVFEQLSTACVESAKLSIRLVENQRFASAQPARSPPMIYYVFTAGVIILLKVFQLGGNMSANPNFAWIFASCLGTLSHYDKKDPSAKRYGEILVGMRDAVFQGPSAAATPSSQGGVAAMSPGSASGRAPGPTSVPAPHVDQQSNIGDRVQTPGALANNELSPYLRSGIVTPSFFDISDIDLAINLNWSFSALGEGGGPMDSEAAQSNLYDTLGPFPGFTMSSGF